MNPAKRKVLVEQVYASKKSCSAQEELVATEAEAVLEADQRELFTDNDVKRAIIAMDNVIIYAKAMRTHLRRAL